jgi:hypothetical protein
VDSTRPFGHQTSGCPRQSQPATCVLNFNYCGVDLDLGEMFLNFPLPLLFRAFSGINLTPFKEALGVGHVSSKDFQL